MGFIVMPVPLFLRYGARLTEEEDLEEEELVQNGVLAVFRLAT